MFCPQPESSPQFDNFQEVINTRNSGSLPAMIDVLQLIDRLQEHEDFSGLLDGQGFLINSFADYPFEAQQQLIVRSIEGLARAVYSDVPAKAVPFLGYLGIARDFGSAPTAEAQEFWQETLDVVQSLYSEMQQRAQSNPDVWQETVSAIGPGLAWLEYPFGATEQNLEDLSAPKLLEAHHLVISMRKLDQSINGELGLREFFGPGGEMENSGDPAVALIAAYDRAQSVEEKTLIAARNLEAGFAADLPGEFEITGNPEQISASKGRIPIRCTARAKTLLGMAQIVDGVRKL